MQNDLALIGNAHNLLWLARGGQVLRWISPGQPLLSGEEIPLPQVEAASKVKTYFHYLGSSQIIETVFSAAEHVLRVLDFFPLENPAGSALLRIVEPMKGALPVTLRWPTTITAQATALAGKQQHDSEHCRLICTEDLGRLLASEVQPIKAPLAFAAMRRDAHSDPYSLTVELAQQWFLEAEKEWKQLPLPKLEKKKTPQLIVRCCQLLRLVADYAKNDAQPAFPCEPLPLSWPQVNQSTGNTESVGKLVEALQLIGDDERAGALEHLIPPTDMDPSTLPEETSALMENGWSAPLPQDAELANLLHSFQILWRTQRPQALAKLLADFPFQLTTEMPQQESPAEEEQRFPKSAHVMGDLLNAGLLPWASDAWPSVQKWLAKQGSLSHQVQIPAEQADQPAENKKVYYRRVLQQLALARGTSLLNNPIAPKELLETAKKLSNTLDLMPDYLGPEKSFFGLVPSPQAHATLLLSWLEANARLAEANPVAEVL